MKHIIHVILYRKKFIVLTIAAMRLIHAYIIKRLT